MARAKDTPPLRPDHHSTACILHVISRADDAHAAEGGAAEAAEPLAAPRGDSASSSRWGVGAAGGSLPRRAFAGASLPFVVRRRHALSSAQSGKTLAALARSRMGKASSCPSKGARTLDKSERSASPG